MACDRFVYWNERKPTREQINELLWDFLGTFCLSIEWNSDRYIATLRGPATRMFKRQGTNRGHRPDRFMEIWLSKKSMDVITREADDATNALADEFARRCAKFYEATYEEEL